MTQEDEEFQRISREIKRRSEEDDDIQDYKKPWVGLTDKDKEYLSDLSVNPGWNSWIGMEQTEELLRKKNT